MQTQYDDSLMNRIVVIGNAGGGKSTLARKLARALSLPYHEIDALLWRPDWTVVPKDEFHTAHDALITNDKWILDGMGMRETIAPRIERADTIIIIDMPLWVHSWLAAERLIKWHTGQLEFAPGGHQTPPPTKAFFETFNEVDQNWMPLIRNLADTAESDGKFVVRLSSLEEVAAFAEKHTPT